MQDRYTGLLSLITGAAAVLAQPDGDYRESYSPPERDDTASRSAVEIGKTLPGEITKQKLIPLHLRCVVFPSDYRASPDPFRGPRRAGDQCIRDEGV